MKKLISIIIILIVFGSCEKSIDFNGHKTEPVTIINGLINPDSTFLVSVIKSRHITDNGQIPEVTNARVEVYKGDVLVEELVHKTNGIYTGFSKPNVDNEYTFKVTIDKDESGAKTLIPLPVVILEANANFNSNINVENEVELTINFIDPVQVENYYRITIHPESDRNSDSENNLYLSSNDLVIRSVFGQDDGLDNTPNNDYLIFNDRLIDGKNYNLKLIFYDSNYYQSIDANSNKYSKTYKLRLHSISKDYYLYLKSRMLANWVTDDPFSEPVPIFSNITGGGGILGAYSTTERSILISTEK